MNFVSVAFLSFLWLSFILYYVTPKKYRWIVLWLVSYAFYWLGGAGSLVFVLTTTLTTYAAALWIGHSHPTNKDGVKKKKAVFVGTLLLNIGILFVLKYYGFFASNFNLLLNRAGFSVNPGLDMLMPLGLSFYTFQSMGYLIDIYQGKYAPEKNPARFALFVSFFPQIIQGPISRYDDVGRQLRNPQSFDYTHVKFGLQLILWGYFKKLIIADRAGLLVNQVFGFHEQFGGFETLAALLCYTLQIYADFSGGIDITRGIAQVFGINLPQNFQQPHFSTSVQTYWRRWHMTLGSWMRDYVFYPMTLSRRFNRIGKWARKKYGRKVGKVLPSFIATFIVFFLIGIWHGSTWNFIFLGFYNAFIVVMGMLCAPLFDQLAKRLKINTACFTYTLWLWLRTFVLILVMKLLSRAPGLKAAFMMLAKIASPSAWNPLSLVDGTLFRIGLDAPNLFVLFLGFLVLLSVDTLHERGINIRETVATQNLIFRWLLYLAAVVVILVLGIYGPAYNAASFIYEQF